jgi:hypothetical protein
VAEKIFRGNRVADPRGRVAARNLRRMKKSLSADYADFADSKECMSKTDLVSKICVNLRIELWGQRDRRQSREG